MTRLEKLTKIYNRIMIKAGDRATEQRDGGYLFIRRGRYEWRVIEPNPNVR